MPVKNLRKIKVTRLDFVSHKYLLLRRRPGTRLQCVPGASLALARTRPVRGDASACFFRGNKGQVILAR